MVPTEQRQVSRRCSIALKATLAERSGLTLFSDTRCGTRLLDTFVAYYCGALLWDTFMGHFCETLLPDTLARHSCKTLTRTIFWDTLA